MVSISLFKHLVLVVWALQPASCGEGTKFTSVPTTVKAFENDTVVLPCDLDHVGNTLAGRQFQTLTVRQKKDLEKRWVGLSVYYKRVLGTCATSVAEIGNTLAGRQFQTLTVRQKKDLEKRWVGLSVYYKRVLGTCATSVAEIETFTRLKWWKGDELLADTHVPFQLLPDRVRLMNRSLEVAGLKASDTGSYTCEVFRQEPWTSIKQTHAIEVQYAPVVTTIPEDGFVEVQKGEYVDIGCDVTGTPTPIINWSKNQIVVNPVTTYQEFPLQKPETQRARRLTVTRETTSTPLACQSMVTKTVDTGYTDACIRLAHFSTNTDGYGYAECIPLQKSTEGEPMALLDHRSRIRFKAETRSLAGVYECIAINGVRDPIKGSITVLIQDAPIVNARQAWVHATPGLRAALEAELEFATPPATTKWFKEGHQVHADDRIVMVVQNHVHQLVFRNVRETDLGNYTFRAENKLGMADVSFKLSGVPNIASFKVDASKNKATATSFTLLWQVDSYSVIIEYNLWLRPYIARITTTEEYLVTEDTLHNRWRRIVVPAGDANDGPIHSSSYVISGLTPASVYEAFVTSRNRFGWSKPSSILHFATEPGIRNQPSTSDYSDVQTPLVLEDVPVEIYNNSLQNSYKKEGENSAPNLATPLPTLYGVLLVVAFLLR